MECEKPNGRIAARRPEWQRTQRATSSRLEALTREEARCDLVMRKRPSFQGVTLALEWVRWSLPLSQVSRRQSDWMIQVRSNERVEKPLKNVETLRTGVFAIESLPPPGLLSDVIGEEADRIQEALSEVLKATRRTTCSSWLGSYHTSSPKPQKSYKRAC